MPLCGVFLTGATLWSIPDWCHFVVAFDFVQYHRQRNKKQMIDGLHDQLHWYLVALDGKRESFTLGAAGLSVLEERPTAPKVKDSLAPSRARYLDGPVRV